MTTADLLNPLPYLVVTNTFLKRDTKARGQEEEIVP